MLGRTCEYIAKANYYNRTWESYEYQSVLRKACENIGLEKEFKEYDDKRTGKERKESEEFLNSFQNLYKATSPELKNKLKDFEITNMEQANGIKMLMALDSITH